MRYLTIFCLAIGCLPAALLAQDAGPAKEMVARLMLMPGATEDPRGIRNQGRWQLIRDIGALGDAAIGALEAGRKDAKTGLQRMELTEALADVQTAEGTRALLESAADADDDVRGAAVIGLAGRVDSPAEQGGDPLILRALAKLAPSEKVEINREYMCNAMRAALRPLAGAEKRDEGRVAIAVGMLKDRLNNDAADQVRFDAACVLTEFGDYSGTRELKNFAIRMQASNDGGTLWGLEQLVAAAERASGRKFGPVPRNPMLSSNFRAVPELKAGRRAVLEKIVEWAREDATMQAVRGR